MSGKRAQEYLYNANIASLFLFCLNEATYINPVARKRILFLLWHVGICNETAYILANRSKFYH